MTLENTLAMASQGHWDTHCNPFPRIQEEARKRLSGQLGTVEILTKRDSPNNISALGVQGGENSYQRTAVRRQWVLRAELVNEISEYL